MSYRLATDMRLFQGDPMSMQATQPPQPAPVTATMTMVSKDTTTDADEPLAYLSTPNPEVSSMILTIPPGGKTEWMTHPVPGYIYILGRNADRGVRGWPPAIVQGRSGVSAGTHKVAPWAQPGRRTDALSGGFLWCEGSTRRSESAGGEHGVEGKVNVHRCFSAQRGEVAASIRRAS